MERLLKDSEFLSFLKENEDEETDIDDSTDTDIRINTRIEDRINTLLPIYEGNYNNIENQPYNIIRIIEAMDFLACSESKLTEMLIFFYNYKREYGFDKFESLVPKIVPSKLGNAIHKYQELCRTLRLKRDDHRRIAAFVVHGLLDPLKYFYNKGEVFDESLFKNAVDNNQLETAQWLYSFMILSFKNIKMCFTKSCRKGYFEMAQWLYTLRDTIITIKERKRFFIINCLYHLNVAKWFYSFNPISNIFDNDSGFKAHLDVIKWVYYDLKGFKINNHIFENSLKSDDTLDIIKWMYYDIGGIQIFEKNIHTIFLSLCKNCDTDKISWFHSIERDKICVHMNDEQSFKSIIFQRNTKYVNSTIWFYNFCKENGLGEIDIHADDDLYFKETCRTGTLHLAKWIYSLGNVDIHAINEAFYLALGYRHITNVKWLYSLKEFDRNILNNIKITDDETPINNWLRSVL